MASILPGGVPADFSVLEFVRIVTRTEEQVKNLTQAMVELRRSVEEMVDRLQEDADEMRKSLVGLVELRNGHLDLGSRISKLELITEKHETRLTSLDEWRTIQKTWLAALTFIGGLAGGLIGHFWK